MGMTQNSHIISCKLDLTLITKSWLVCQTMGTGQSIYRGPRPHYVIRACMLIKFQYTCTPIRACTFIREARVCTLYVNWVNPLFSQSFDLSWRFGLTIKFFAGGPFIKMKYYVDIIIYATQK